MLVEARLEGWSKPCSGMIMRNNRDETYNIAFDDGHRVEGVHATHIRSLKMGGFAADAFRALPQAHGAVLYSIGRKVVLEVLHPAASGETAQRTGRSAPLALAPVAPTEGAVPRGQRMKIDSKSFARPAALWWISDSGIL